MELIKRNIHMDCIKTQAVTQFTLEEDVNIPDSKPDVHSLNLERAELVTEEIRPGTDMVTVRGNLKFQVLYHTLEEGSSLILLEGQLPFEEKIHMKDVQPGDNVTVEGSIEDLTISMIHSRKLNVQALITLSAKVEEIQDEEVPIAISGEEKCEYRKMPMTAAKLAIRKNDVFRLKEEINLPSHYPNIFQILWDNVSTGDMAFKVMDDKIAISGDVHFFLLYEGEGEEHPVQTFETTLPFTGTLECSGAKEGMIPDIRCHIGQKGLTVRPDFDGEERSVGMELSLEIDMRIYEEEDLEVISDIYGVSEEISVQSHPANLKKLLSCVTGKTKLTEHVQVGTGNVLQLLHSEGTVTLEKQNPVENGILLQGNVCLKVMYSTGEDDSPYGCIQTRLPYQYTLEIPDMTPEDMGNVHGEAEQLQVTMLDGEELDVKVILCFSTSVFRNSRLELIQEINAQPLDTEKMSRLPGMVVYVVKDGDSLWNIGKKYYVTVDTLRSLNELEGDTLVPGQKLLVVKGG